jgi:hypothetical protein
MMNRFAIHSLKLFMFFGIMSIVMSSSYLDTEGRNNLKMGEILTSPLGDYRVQFLSNCSLQIQEFN